jgi:hypothetical protein
VIEPPLDSNILEKPCTIVLFEDQSLVAVAARSCNDDTTVGGRNNNNDMTKKQQTNRRPPSSSSDDDSWVSHFQRRIPEEYGMSFAYLSFQQDDDNHSKETKHEDVPTSSSSSSSSTGGIIADCVTSMKFSNGLSAMRSDIVLITRGPVSSLCAQYYLESCSLLGLVMIDPILLSDDDDDEQINNNSTSIVANIMIHTDDDRKRFRNSSLLLEPNAVPMMVVLSQQDDVDWNRSSRMVARRHSDGVMNGGGPYGGDVPIVDLKKKEDGDENSTAPEHDLLMDIVNEWTDDIL